METLCVWNPMSPSWTISVIDPYNALQGHIYQYQEKLNDYCPANIVRCLYFPVVLPDHDYPQHVGRRRHPDGRPQEVEVEHGVSGRVDEIGEVSDPLAACGIGEQDEDGDAEDAGLGQEEEDQGEGIGPERCKKKESWNF